MKKILFLAAVTVTLVACNNDDETLKVDNRDPNVIWLTAGVDASAVVTRAAVNTFPNATESGATIAVVARYTKNGVGESAQEYDNWDNLHVDHVPADVQDGAVTEGGSEVAAFKFAWPASAIQYWPTAGRELQFLAYSPVADGTIIKAKLPVAVETEGKVDNAKIDITLPKEYNKMPDIIVASHNKDGELIKGYKKPLSESTSGESEQSVEEVNFQFKHILSQLVLKVKSAGDDGATLKKAEILIGENSVNGIFDMTADMEGVSPSVNAQGWSTGKAATGGYTYEYTELGYFSQENGNTITVTENPLLLIPDTQKEIKVRLTLSDADGGNEDVQDVVCLSDAVLGSSDTHAALVMGKTTTLTITISRKAITGMTGSVTEWVELGDYGIVIE